MTRVAPRSVRTSPLRGLAAITVRPGRPFELARLPTPEVEPGGILIKNTAAAICGSDLHAWRNDMRYTGPDWKRISGHEFTGLVHTLGRGVATDSLRRPLREGDRVVFPFFNPCHRCYQCIRGELHACPNSTRRSARLTVDEYPYCDGGYAEYYYLPPGHYVFKVPDVLSDEIVPLVNCAVSQALQGIERAHMRFGDTVVIQGAGGLGILATAVAAEKGASQVITIDGQAPRLELARTFGATSVIDMREHKTPEARVARVRELTGGVGADIVVEVVGVASATLEGLDMVRLSGTYVDIGNVVGGEITLATTKVISQQITWLGVTRYNPWVIPAALELLVRVKDRFSLSKVVSHSYPLTEINSAFEFAEWQGKAGGTPAVRVLLKP